MYLDQQIVLIFIILIAVIILIALFKAGGEYFGGLPVILGGFATMIGGSNNHSNINNHSSMNNHHGPITTLESAPLEHSGELYPSQYEGGAEEIYAMYNDKNSKKLELERQKRLKALENIYRKAMADIHKENTIKISEVKLTNTAGGKKVNKIIGFHFAEWCIYCNEMKSVWKDIMDDMSKESNIAFIAINEEKHRNPVISTIPTIVKYVEDGKNNKIEIYRGKAKAHKLVKWINAS